MRISTAALFAPFLLSCTAPAQGWDATNTWAFNPKSDDFRADALLDLRSMNEKVAGESGYVTVNSEGEFVLGSGKPVRFWAVNTGVGREKPFVKRPLGRQTEPDLARHARFLAKRGVNMIRLHLQISPSLDANPNAKLSDINQAERDYVWRAIAAFKKEGIYTTLSLYWGVPMKFSTNFGIPGDPKQSALGLLFFDKKLQDGYKEWIRQVLTPPNPYTGIPVAKDPSLAVFQIQNEDSLLFWTVSGIAGPQKVNLERLYGNFLAKKHGGANRIYPAWENDRAADAPAEGRYELLNIWEMTQQRTGGRHKRLSDQTHFYAQTMFDFNKMVVDYVRKDLGCKALVNAGNWKTADTVRLNDAERWSYLPGEVDAVNHYTGGIHQGANNGWAIENGNKFTSDTHLLAPASLPVNLKSTVGRPLMITESAWVMPNGYASEGPFLVSAYSALTGVSSFYWFATGDDEWSQPTSANGYMPSQSKWMFGNPDMLGTFPAAALVYRNRLVQKGAPSVVEERSLQNLWERRTPIIAEVSGFDPNRDAGDIAPTSSVKAGLDPLVFLTGPVQVKFDGDPAKTKVTSLTPLIDKANGTVKSSTGELLLNWNRGFATVNAPMAQGVAAHFVRQPVHRLKDVTISSRNTFGAVMVVSMDGKPIAESSKLLVQVGTQSRPTGWQEAPATLDVDGKKISGWEVRSYGAAPWRVQSAQVDVIVKNPKLTKATTLDMNGNAVGAATFTKTADGTRLQFPANAMYVVLQ